MTWSREQWNKERATHRFVTLNGEDYACTWCDSKTGNGICPGDGTQYIDEYLAPKGEREGDQLTDYGQAIYSLDPPDPIERPF